MTSEAAPVLGRAAEFLFAQAQQDPGGGRQLEALALVLQHLADFVDDYAVSCLKQAETIKAILSDTCRIMPPSERGELEAAIALSPVAPEDFHAKQLERYLERLKAALVRAHGWLETSDAAERRQIIDRIWEYLGRQAKRESRLVPAMW